MGSVSQSECVVGSIFSLSRILLFPNDVVRLRCNEAVASIRDAASHHEFYASFLETNAGNDCKRE